MMMILIYKKLPNCHHSHSPIINTGRAASCSCLSTGSALTSFPLEDLPFVSAPTVGLAELALPYSSQAMLTALDQQFSQSGSLQESFCWQFV